ncbi:hypothetical protein C0585_07245 [Candidatus Woesearchaeota archaeon]|nr:MAG: hypothetical protein C0585_07245 [Candidatus Woesearchaeota archaeon]
MVLENKALNLQTMLKSSKRLAKIIKKDEKAVSKDIELVEHLYKDLEETAIPEGDTDLTEQDIKKFLHILLHGFEKDFEIEKFIEAYLGRVEDDISDVEKDIVKDGKDVDGLKINVSPELLKGTLRNYSEFGFNKVSSVDEFKKKLKDSLKLIFDKEEELKKAIDTELSQLAVLARQQSREKKTLNQQLFTLLKDFKAKSEARALRRQANQEDKAVDEIESDLKEVDKLLGKNISSADNLKKLCDLIVGLVPKIKDESKLIKDIIDESLFIFKFAVYLFFKLDGETEKLEGVFSDIISKGFDEEKGRVLSEELSKLKNWRDSQIVHIRRLSRQAA